MKEQVNHPEHYKDESGKECIDYMEDIFGPLCVFIFCILNSYKYNFRKGKKDDNPELQDIRKCSWYYRYAVHLYSCRLNCIQKWIARRILSRYNDTVAQ